MRFSRFAVHRQMITVLIILFYFSCWCFVLFLLRPFYPAFKSIFITLWFLSHFFRCCRLGNWILCDSRLYSALSSFVLIHVSSDYSAVFFIFSWFPFPNYSLNVCFFVHLSVSFYFIEFNLCLRLFHEKITNIEMAVLFVAVVVVAYAHKIDVIFIV